MRRNHWPGFHEEPGRLRRAPPIGPAPRSPRPPLSRKTERRRGGSRSRLPLRGALLSLLRLPLFPAGVREFPKSALRSPLYADFSDALIVSLKGKGEALLPLPHKHKFRSPHPSSRRCAPLVQDLDANARPALRVGDPPPEFLLVPRPHAVPHELGSRSAAPARTGKGFPLRGQRG